MWWKLMKLILFLAVFLSCAPVLHADGFNVRSGGRGGMTINSGGRGGMTLWARPTAPAVTITVVQSTGFQSHVASGIGSSTFAVATTNTGGAIVFKMQTDGFSLSGNPFDNKGNVYYLASSQGDSSLREFTFYSTNVVAGVLWIAENCAGSCTPTVEMFEASSVTGSTATAVLQNTANSTHFVSASTPTISGSNLLVGGGGVVSGSRITLTAANGYTLPTSCNMPDGTWVQGYAMFQVASANIPLWDGQLVSAVVHRESGIAIK